MIRCSSVLLLFFSLINVRGLSQEHLIVKKNLQLEWQVYDGKSLGSFSTSNKSASTIYFSIPGNIYSGDYLIIENVNYFSIFLNGSLILDKVNRASLPIDSLAQFISGRVLFFSIYERQNINPTELQTAIYSTIIVAKSSADEFALKKDMSFRDFVVTAALILLIFLVSVIRLNPKLSSDYFSVVKIFSLRESEDDQFYYRSTSTNILFYVFTSMVWSLFLLLVGQFLTFNNGLGLPIQGTYFGYFLSWGKISLIILMLLFLKISITYLVAFMFDVREIAGFHFFNFIRLTLVMVGLLTLILTIYFIAHGQSQYFYSLLFKTLGWIFGGWIILFFLKLTNRMRYSVFHLFSYICATEIIPVLLIIKVLYK